MASGEEVVGVREGLMEIGAALSKPATGLCPEVPAGAGVPVGAGSVTSGGWKGTD
jgi:hypothetical protein